MILAVERKQTRLFGWGHFCLAPRLLACILGLSVCSSLALAQGGLLVTPRRIVFEGRDRSAEVTLSNRGSVAGTYRISFKNMRMLENGAYEDIEEPRAGELLAASMLSYAPRQVVLEPGAAQTVRLLVRKPGDLQPGEYRSHLWLQAIPPAEQGQDIEALALDQGQIGLQVRTIFGVTIPVIVRHGELSATVALSDLAVKPAEKADELPLLFLRLNRRGDRSVFGDFTVSFLPDRGGPEQVVGLARSVVVYTPNLTRTIQFPLRLPEGVVLRDGRLHVAYSARPEEGGQVLAEADIPVP